MGFRPRLGTARFSEHSHRLYDRYMDLQEQRCRSGHENALYQNYYLDATTYAEEVAYVSNFAAARIAWLDEQFGYHPTAISTTKKEAQSLPQIICSPDGIHHSSLQPGLNIIRYRDGNSRKIWKK